MKAQLRVWAGGMRRPWGRELGKAFSACTTSAGLSRSGTSLLPQADEPSTILAPRVGWGCPRRWLMRTTVSQRVRERMELEVRAAATVVQARHCQQHLAVHGLRACGMGVGRSNCG